MWFPFTVADSGDIVGKMTAYYATGTVTGDVDLTETSSTPPTPYVFGNADLSGTLKIAKIYPDARSNPLPEELQTFFSNVPLEAAE